MKNFLFTGFIILLLSAVSCKTTEKGSMTQTQTPTSQTNEKKNISTGESPITVLPLAVFIIHVPLSSSRFIEMFFFSLVCDVGV